MDAVAFVELLSRLDHQLALTLGDWVARYGAGVYLLLFAIVFSEIGVAPLFFLPGDPLLFLCGALAAAGGLNVWILLPLFLAAAWLGSLLAYAVGRWLGQQARVRNPRWLNREALARAQRFFDGYGGLGLLVSPYIAVLRSFAPLAAGIARMRPARFVAAAGGGAALWSIGLVGGGYCFGNVPLVREHMGSLILAGLLLGLGGLLWRARRR